MSNRWEVAVNRARGEQQFTYRHKRSAMRSYHNKIQYHNGNSHNGKYREEDLEVQLNDLESGITLLSYTIGVGAAPKEQLAKAQGL